jgi:carbon-monoxide dehydrogenase medium subunit
MKPLTGFDLLRPRTLVGVLEMLSALQYSQLIAGGTDIIPLFKDVGSKQEHLVDLSLIPELNGVTEETDHVSIGSTTTHSQILASRIVEARVPALRDACGILGSVQIRNRGTVGGNLCNASPAADTAPPLLVHAAEACIGSLRETRWIHLFDFFAGPKKSVLHQDEILVGIRVPTPPKSSGSAFQRIGRRAGFCLSVVNCASYLERDKDRVKTARIAVGSVAPTPLLIEKVDGILSGKKMTEKLIEEAGRVCAESVNPIDDVRGSAEYRRDMTAVLAKRTLREAWRRSGGEVL